MTQSSSPAPALLEDHIPQVLALQLLQNLGYRYLRPQEVYLERRGNLTNVLLEGILGDQLRKLNRITYKGQSYQFSDANIHAAIEALQEVPINDLIHASEKIYDLLYLGKSLKQAFGEDSKSFTLNFIDWNRFENNVFHLAGSFEVRATKGKNMIRPDLVLFINGIPLAVIECCRYQEYAPLDGAIHRHLNNQGSAAIPRLFIYSQMLLATGMTEAKYATTGTAAEYWSHWREPAGINAELSSLINQPLTGEQKERLFADRFASIRTDFDDLELEERPVCEQDKAIYSLCLPGRLIELAHRYIVFQEGKKKIANQRQYFSIKQTLERAKFPGAGSKHRDSVIRLLNDHALTMIMTAKAILLEKPDSRIVLVTGEDDQAFKSLELEMLKAKTGRHLLEMLALQNPVVIITSIEKFEISMKARAIENLSPEIFILFDLRHYSMFAEVQARIKKVLPNACFIGFANAPPAKREKAAAVEFSSEPGSNTLEQALIDKRIVPLFYENRHFPSDGDRKAVNDFFNRRTKFISSEQRRELNKPGDDPAEERIFLIAWDIGRHLRECIERPFKGLLVTGSGDAAARYRHFFDQFGMSNIDEEIRILEAPPRIDDPSYSALYLDLKLGGHELLQLMPNINRYSRGKDFGFVIDYSSAIPRLSDLFAADGPLFEYDIEDFSGALREFRDAGTNLAQQREKLCNIFNDLPGPGNEEAFERILADEKSRENFHSRLFSFSRAMNVAFSSIGYLNDTPDDALERYRTDLEFFRKLQRRIRMRYAENLEAEIIAPLAHIPDREKFRTEIDKLPTLAARADTIAYQIKRAIRERLKEDQYADRRRLYSLEHLIRAWRDGRISDEYYLEKAVEIMNSILDRTANDFPSELQNHELAIAYFGLLNQVFSRWKDDLPDQRTIAVKAALKIERIIREKMVENWSVNQAIQNQMINQIEDYLYALKEMYGIDMSSREIDLILEKSIEITINS
ncbi:MAG: hypothetical protein L0220_02745 [Acidobacteria bacterium]|nr:hypothetical protein [Acidobacteriota bacterium]